MQHPKIQLNLSLGQIGIYLFLTLFLCLPTSVATASPETATQLIQNKNWSAARDEVMRSGNPALYKFYEWSLYRDDFENLPFERIASFIKQNPHWPDQNKLLATAERNMPTDYSTHEIMSWFAQFPPVTGIGIKRLFTAGQTAIPIINASWPSADMTRETQNNILSRYGRYISAQSHESRIDYLIKAESYTLARGMGAALQNGYKQLVEARIALTEGKGNALDLLYNVPENLQNNTGLLFDRAKWLRKNNNDTTAISILLRPIPASSMTFAEEWWKERNILVRRMIEDKNYQRAYDISSRHNMTEGPEFADAEWISGWLALRFLNKPDLASSHFTRMYNKVETAISKARGAYWSARAASALGKSSEAQTWYYQAATYPHTYYGQIALKHLKMTAPRLSVTPATSNDHAAVTSSDLVQVAVLLHNTGNESLSAKFINASLDKFETAGEYQALATYLKRIGDTSGAYRVAKRASWKNIFLGDTAYPSLMKWVGGLSIDPALAHAVIRQESQFDSTAKSPAGALGLMQLMPATAREVAKKRGWDHNTSWLTTRPEHNILLGSAYMNGLLERFNGSYPLAIAAYNAGPSRVNGWLETFGDPRTGNVSWIDWLELIPIAETRNYVQRVTEGVVIYRDHLGIVKE